MAKSKSAPADKQVKILLTEAEHRKLSVVAAARGVKLGAFVAAAAVAAAENDTKSVTDAIAPAKS
jgi:uncharacterized protein (DUF1778 family)